MSLADFEHAIQRVCTARTPDPADLSLLGDNRVWLVYRGMVRRRLHAEVGRVFSRTRAAIGEDAFDACFEAVLEREPPTTRFFYGVPLWFARSAEPMLREDAALPPHAVDLLRYEAARWEVADLDGRPQVTPKEFAFDAVAVLSPSMRLLTVDHAVHHKPAGDGSYAPGVHHLLLHRASDDAPVKTWSVNAVTRDLLAQLQATPIAVTEAVAAVASKRGVAVDGPFVEGLCTVLADFIERGVVLGSR